MVPRRKLLLLLAFASAGWYACADFGPGSATGPFPQDLRTLLAVQRKHTPALMEIPGVVGTAVTDLGGRRAGILVLTERSGIALPQLLDGIPVVTRVSGRLMVFSDPTQRRRPAPAGFSVGHPAITAGTIGARVRDALGRVYILSNNHVLANSNGAAIGDPEYQPGPFDGGTPADQIATLSDFQLISFTGGNNTIDAAIALSTSDVLDNAVPSDDGYGMPNATIYGDADGDGFIDDRGALLGLNVQKYGRTTRLTHGQITGVNATVTVCYAVSGFTCTKSARFVDQLIISPAGFSNGGDSGSLIVTDDGSVNPVGLLFAGSSSVTIANRIDLVLNRFGVAIDGFAPPPPGPLTDVAVTAISGPSFAVQNNTASLAVTVRNFGNQDVAGFNVTLQDTTDQVAVGSQAVASLAAGATATVVFAWTPTSTGDHALVARHDLSDDRPANDQRSATIPVNPAVTDLAVTTLSPSGPVIEGHIVTVSVTVANVGNQPISSGFEVALHDSTAESALGTQSVAGLPVGAARTLTFTWDLTGAALGTHILVATQGLSDDNGANDRRTTSVTVNPKPTDIAAVGITAPARVTQGDTAHVVVSVKNVGEVDVTSSFSVDLTDAAAGGALVGRGTVTGLAVGATAAVDIPWATAGATTEGHTLFATQRLPDAVGSNNSIAISVIVNPPPVLDLAVTSVSAPATVTQGASAAVSVTVANVGGANVTSSFNLVLTDATSGATVGSQTITGLAPGGNTTRTFNWNTAGAGLGSHTLVAGQSLADDNAANNQASVTIGVTAPALDVAVTSVTAPATVMKGGTATVSVTVQNVAAQSAGTFTVVLTDATAGGTIGTQTVAGLAAGGSATRSFSWNTGNAALGSHTLVATQTLADDNPSNNQRSVAINVTPAPADIAVTAIAAPSQVTIGDTVPVVVTVQNAGGQDVTAGIDVVLTDGSANNAVIGAQTIPGLSAGTSTTRTFAWNTAGAALNGHILIATQKLPDGNSGNNSRAIAVNVNAPSLHVGNLNGVAASTSVDAWSATAEITAHDGKHNPVSGVTVRGLWNGTGPEISCVTAEAGTCTVALTAIPNATRMVSFAPTGMTLNGFIYKAAGNHDPDGSSNGFSVTVKH